MLGYDKGLPESTFYQIRLLSELEADGQIERLRRGREKIVVDPERLPPALTEGQ